MVGRGEGIPGPKLLEAKPFMVGRGEGIPGPKLLEAKPFMVGRGEGIPGPNEGAAKAAEAVSVRAAKVARRTKVIFMEFSWIEVWVEIWIEIWIKMGKVWPLAPN